jgi:putative FmdB family regulatory protein
MPTYDYRCNACGHEFELFQSMSDPVKKKCPECSKLALERLIGAGAIRRQGGRPQGPGHRLVAGHRLDGR